MKFAKTQDTKESWLHCTDGASVLGIIAVSVCACLCVCVCLCECMNVTCDNTEVVFLQKGGYQSCNFLDLMYT